MAVTRRNARQHAEVTVFGLPNELLLEAFAWGLNAQWDAITSSWETESIKFLRSITAVCSHWRRVAISDSLLWRRIYVIRRHRAAENYDSISHRLRTFLARSKNVTLDIYIYIHDRNPAVEILQRLINILLRHIQRCRTLEIVYGPANHVPFTIEPSGPLTHLTHLRIETDLWGHHLPFLTIIGAGNMAPLQCLELQLEGPFGIVELDGLKNLRTEHLRRLRIQCYRDDWFSDLMEFVTCCTNVEELSLGFLFPDGPVHIKPIVLNKVKELSDSCCSRLFALCQILSTPALEKLSIDAGSMRHGDDLKDDIEAVAFLRLRTFTIQDYGFEDDDILLLHKFFRANPSIHEIHIEQCLNHWILLYAMLGPISEDETDVLIPDLGLFDLLYFEHTDASKRMLPKLKKLSFVARTGWAAVVPENLSDMFAHVLWWWENAQIIIGDWESYGGTKYGTGMLVGHFKNRFSFLGDYPAGTD